MLLSRAPATRNAVAILIKDEALGLVRLVTSVCKRHLHRAHTTTVTLGLCKHLLAFDIEHTGTRSSKLGANAGALLPPLAPNPSACPLSMRIAKQTRHSECK